MLRTSDRAEQAQSMRRRGAQFRLRSLLIGMVLCCVALAVIVPYIESYRREWRVYRELSRLPQPARIIMAPGGPGWLQSLGAERFLQRIGAVELDDCDDDSLALLAGLPALESLKIHSPKVTDNGLRHIERCPNLLKLRAAWPRCPVIVDW